ncbi:hypothetical protein HFD88_003557 [Aspergillus terreus]|nr:hypothetical protein HFD88_003557 [Aspergillus terreus]
MTSEKPIIVIIPGAFHKPIHYRKISKPLQSDGYEVLEFSHIVCGDKVDPEKTFFDDAAEIRKKPIPLFDQGRHAVIMSHSYGSLPATASVEGQTVIEHAERGLVGGIVAVISIAGFVFPTRGKGIMGDDQIVPPPPYHIVQYVESEIRCPKTYILCEQDQAVPPTFQEQMARLGGFDIARANSACLIGIAKPVSEDMLHAAGSSSLEFRT